MKKDIKIAIAGRSGCGNTTVSKMVADALGLKFINFTFRTLAEEKGIDLKTVLNLAGKDDYWDKEVDSRQVKIARSGGGCVLGSRLSIWMLEEADLKIFLTAKPQTRAERILNREGGDLQEIMEFTAERDRQDHARYLRIYGIDNDKYSFVDMIIDTDEIKPEEISKMIIERAKQIE